MIRPLRGYVLIEPEKAENKTSSGVYLPENSQDKQAKGKVIALSPFIPLPDRDYLLLEDTTLTVEYRKLLKIGITVYFKKWGGEIIKEDGKEYVFVKFEDLLGVISE